MRFRPGDIIDGRFEVLRPLGAGGMGEVYVVRHVHLDRQEALKVLLPGLHPLPDIRERFVREARAASMLKHECIIEVHDFDVLPDGTPFYTMELLEGEDLSATLAREGPLPWTRVRKFAFQVCRAIAMAHDHGIIHRDLKPANCFLLARGPYPDAIKVLDFGIAKVLAANTLTGDGVMIGSPHYMSPEQTRGPLLDPRTDIYSLGVVLYELLSGKLPFDADELPALIYAIQNTEPRPLRQAAPGLEIPIEVEALVARAMAKSPDARFPTIRAMAMEISRLSSADLVRARPAPAQVDPLGKTDAAHEAERKEPEEAKTIARSPALAATDEDAETRMYRRDQTEEPGVSAPKGLTPARPRQATPPGSRALEPTWLLLAVALAVLVAGLAIALR